MALQAVDLVPKHPEMSAHSISAEKERFIPIPKGELVDILIQKLGNASDKTAFRELCCAIESLFHVQRISQIEEIKKCYSTFDRRKMSNLRNLHEKLDIEDLKNRQNTLLKNIFTILDDANFTPITAQNYKNAMEAVFLTDMPIVVDWPKLDAFMLQHFFEEYSEHNPYSNENGKNGLKIDAPPFWQHFVIFHRGYGLHERCELFFNHKINILSQNIYTILKLKMIDLFHLMTAKLFACNDDETNDTKSESITDLTGISGNEHHIDDFELPQRVSIERYLSTYPPSNGVIVDANDEQENKENKNNDNDNDKDDKDDKKVKFERISLVDTYKEAKKDGISGIIWWFLSNVTLKEPTFNDLVLVFRELPENLFDEKLRRAKERSKKYGKSLMKAVQTRAKLLKDKKAPAAVAAAMAAVTKTKTKTGETKDEASNEDNSVNNTAATEATSDDSEESNEAKQEKGENESEGSESDKNSKNIEKEKEKKKKIIIDETGRSRDHKCLEAPKLQSIDSHIESVLRQPIRINYFAQVPMADLEVVFPCKRLSLRTMERAYLFVILFMGIYVILKEIFVGNAYGNGIFNEFVVIGFIVLMIRTVQWYQLTQKNYEFSLNSILYDSSMASDENVLISLLETVQEQEFMETILAYFVILVNKHDDTLTIDDTNKVDRLCEALIIDEIGNKNVDVEISDAMRKLKELGLLKMDTFDDVIEVKELNDAINTVKQHWQSFANEWKHGWNTTMIRTREPSISNPFEANDECDTQHID